VHMEWLEGGKAYRTLYDVSYNDKVLLARPTKLVSFSMPNQLTSSLVTSSSRVGVNKFGMYLGGKDTVEKMQLAKDRGALHVKYLGKVQLDDMVCFKFVRAPYNPPEGLPGEDLQELTLYIDEKTRLQV